MQSNELKYPVGSFIKWCGEYLKVLSNNTDYVGKVQDMGGDIISNFYFKYQGEEAKLITDEKEISELSSILNKTLTVNKFII